MAIEDWQENQTITTLESISAPVTGIQFPTVTFCPDRFTPPDNWALPEIILNSLAFECYDDEFPECSKGEKLRKDFKKLISDLHSELMRRAGQGNFQFSNELSGDSKLK